MLRRIVGSALLWLAVAGSAQAQYLVDTGTPPGPGAYSLGDIQSVGASFTLLSAAKISSVEVFLSTTGGQVLNTDLTVSLYEGDPGGTALFERSLDIVVAPGWFVVDALTWQVAAGEYTVTFASSQTGNVLGTRFGAPIQLPLWSLNSLNPDWVLEVDPPGGIGVRIGGEPIVAIPEPETYALLAAGLALLGGVAKRRKLAQRRR